MVSSVYEWIENNSPLISSIYTPLTNSENELVQQYDEIFRDSIRENTKLLLYSMVCIEFSRATGGSTEEFYSAIDVDSLYDFIVRLEEYYSNFD